MKYSNNKKLNDVLNKIEEQLLTMCDSKEESIREIARYRNEFWYEPDYCLYQYGNILIYYYQIRSMYQDSGYKSMEYGKISNNKLVEIYKRQTRFVADCLIEQYYKSGKE